MTIELANRLAELRKLKGLSQEELADKLQVSRQAISKWERGEASPDTDNLIELAKIYDVSLDELVGLSSNKENKKEEKKDAKEGVVIDDNGIHITDDEGNKVEVSEGKVHLYDEDGKEVVKKGPSKEQRFLVLISSVVTLTVVIAYLLLGSILDLWAKAWVLFLLVVIVPSIFEAFVKHKPQKFSYAVFIAFIYLLLNVWILENPLWHPLWVLFITIPVFYAVMTFIKHRNDDDIVVTEKDED